ncbi:MAG TPA: M48 family metallopeptidase [Candidatus Adamsella sp.]|nr:M48 family metallopeptidase [Candidatus Adamsella sp.]
MKKVLVLLFLLFFTNLNAYAGSDYLFLDKETKYQKKIMEMGFRILNANRIDKRMTFSYDTNKDVNAYTYGGAKNIVICKGLLPYFDDDNELAAILSHEIAHGMDYHDGFFKSVAMGFAPKKYEEKADKQAVDYMVTAGYNPVALIIVLNKISGEKKGISSWFSTHPAGSRRLVLIYEYIYKKYPGYLVDNDYRRNLYYQNFLLISKDDREKIRERELKKIEKNRKKNEKKEAV